MFLLSPTNSTNFNLSSSSIPFYTSSPSTIPSFSSLSIRSQPPIHPLCSRSAGIRLGRCRAACPGPPPPPRIDPPPGNDSRRLAGLAASLSTFQDRVQIFFAVLFWMSLFFWASAWDGRNRPNKGSRFKR